MRQEGMFPAGIRPIAPYRVEGEEDGVGKHPREKDDAGYWGHGQDRPPGGTAAQGARNAHAGRIPLRRAAVRLGGRSDVGARAGGRGVGVRFLLPVSSYTWST